MSESASNPILEQIPLITSPGQYKKRKTVTLPYDLEKLPQEFPDNEQKSLNDIKERFTTLQEREKRMIDRVEKLYNDSCKQPFEEWEKEVRRAVPGYIKEDGSIGIMTPTKKVTNIKETS
ncbi:hypothetical protein HII13_002113 [Brettanomyces bruxellensis]|uniref:Uncharacterized protein n=1 Tax=Dekkera bruxellensis TaxID=5007 RepID=A0A8H6EV76_DEKBR|nr:uncharacterized protein BRETT_000362 [Brettanomyces bruxellensis]KAF6011648.1 hypothetical protein HII13_002113 [Brettanomyces bruxellensis]QOU20651.1 hypothetical protein BRETT_000362 [Brettanomyces bruxellensis]